MEDTAIELTIVMPCLNEILTLGKCIKKAQSFIDRTKTNAEILIGDNGSEDGSQALAVSLGARVVDVPVRGYGAALYYSSIKAKGKYIIMGDSDDSYDFSSLDGFLTKLRQGYDLVMGNRFQGGIKDGAMPWKNRYIGNPILSGIGRIFFNCPAKDFHCGLRGYSKEAFHKFDMRTVGMEFASEMVIKATLLNMKITEVPTTLSPDGRDRPPHLRPWRDGWRHLRFMLLYSPKWLFLYPGALIFITGLLLTVILCSGSILVGGVVFDIHTLLFSAFATIIGFQSISFAVFSKIFAISEGLLPEDKNFSKIAGLFSLEKGVIIGSILVFAGLAGTFFAFSTWERLSFGDLSPRDIMRLVIPSLLSLTIGLQIVLGSFFLSVLGLRLRKL